MITADASDVFWFGKRRYYIGFHDFTTSNALHEFVNHQKQARFTLAVGKIRSSEAERERDYAFPSALRKAQARDPINKLRKHFLSSWARTPQSFNTIQNQSGSGDATILSYRETYRGQPVIDL